MFSFSFQITVRRKDRRDPLKLYNKMNVGDLSKSFTGVRALIILITDNERAGSAPFWVGWLVGCFGLGLTALLDNISVYIGPSPREREKEERNDRRENKNVQTNPHPHLLQAQ